MKNRYEFITSLVKEAGAKVLVTKEKQVEVSIKNNNPRDLVTNVDIEVSNFISDKIREFFPGEPIYSEEATDEDISSGSFWAIDPIDGTACFSRSLPHFSVVLAYVQEGEAVVGGIYNPVTDELFSFIKDGGAYLNSKRVNVSGVRDLSKAYVFVRAGRNPDLWDWGAKAYRFLLENANKVFNLGSSALDICFVGSGRIEACLYSGLTSIDIAAALGFLKEAGGIVVGKGGAPITKLTREPQPIIVVNSSEVLSAISAIIP